MPPRRGFLIKADIKRYKDRPSQGLLDTAAAGRIVDCPP